MIEGPEVAEDVGEVFWGETVLGGFAGDVDLEQNREMLVCAFEAALEGLGELEAVDGVDAVKDLDHFAGFSALNVADHVPGDGTAEGFDLGGGDFDAVFAHVGDAEGVEDAAFVDPNGLGDGDELDGAEFASSAVAGGGDARLNGVEIGVEARFEFGCGHRGRLLQNKTLCCVVLVGAVVFFAAIVSLARGGLPAHF